MMANNALQCPGDRCHDPALGVGLEAAAPKEDGLHLLPVVTAAITALLAVAASLGTDLEVSCLVLEKRSA